MCIVGGMTVDRKRFGPELRRRRLKAGLTQVELAEKAGLTANSVARMERGEQGLSLTAGLALAAALGCRIEDLVGRPKR
jgi:transcriptional regulator with XRE-family HTH domain